MFVELNGFNSVGVLDDVIVQVTDGCVEKETQNTNYSKVAFRKFKAENQIRCGGLITKNSHLPVKNERPNDQVNFNWSYFESAVRFNDVVAVSKILNSVDSVNFKKPGFEYTPLEFVFNEFKQTPVNIEIVKLLINKGADPLQKCSAGQIFDLLLMNQGNEMRGIEALKYLFSEIIDPNLIYRGESLLHRVLSSCKLPQYRSALINVLLKRGTNIDFLDWYGRSPIYSAIIKNDLTSVQLLVESGANLKITDTLGYSPLELAIFNKRLGIAQYLILAGADIHSKNPKTGENALHIACKKGDLECVKFLIMKGADLQTTNGQGKSCLHLASEMGFADLISFLIKQSKFLDKIDLKGCTSLFYAAQNGHLSAVKILVQAGANVNCSPSPLKIAIQKGHTDIANYLVSMGAVI